MSKGKRRENETRHFGTFVIIFFPSLFFCRTSPGKALAVNFATHHHSERRGVTYEVEKLNEAKSNFMNKLTCQLLLILWKTMMTTKILCSIWQLPMYLRLMPRAKWDNF